MKSVMRYTTVSSIWLNKENKEMRIKAQNSWQETEFPDDDSVLIFP